MEEKLAESVERDAFHETRRDDPIRVDVVARNVHATTCH
jgi:hypothetical protein